MIDTRTTLFTVFVLIIITIREIYLAGLEEKMTGGKNRTIYGALHDMVNKAKQLFRYGKGK